MAFQLIRFIAVADDGAESVVVFPGALAGAKDLEFKLGSAIATGKIFIKRDGTLLDSEDALEGLAGGGSSIFAQSFGLYTALASAEFGTSSGQFMAVMVNVPSKRTATGVKFVQITQGLYTASNENRIGLYSYSAGTLTLVASTADDGNLWKDIANTLHAEPFTEPVEIDAGTYWIGHLFSGTSITSSPEIAAAPLAASGTLSTLDLTNDAKTYCSESGVTALPATKATPALTENSGRPWLALYEPAEPATV